MLIDCACGATNRIPGMSKVRHRCGKCQHVFTPQELVKARPEPAPPKPNPSLEDLFGRDFSLDDLLLEEDDDDEDSDC